MSRILQLMKEIMTMFSIIMTLNYAIGIVEYIKSSSLNLFENERAE